MSDRTKGVVFESEEAAAHEFFCGLNAGTFLRLTRLDAQGLWGIYAEGWPGDDQVLEDIARQASSNFGLGLLYRYDGCVGYLCELFENGTRTATQDTGDQSVARFEGDVFKRFGRDTDMHDKVEVAFCWRAEGWELEA